MERFRLPKIHLEPVPMPKGVEQMLQTAEHKLAHRPKLLALFKNCFPNTLETTTKLMEDGTTFIITGDIPAMWLRDSVEQVRHYLPFAKGDDELQKIIGGLIRRQMMYILKDPYANAFNEGPNDWHWDANDETGMSPWVWERKFELDSLCFPMQLAYLLWKETGKTDIFDENFRMAMRKTVDLWKVEQHHGENSTYTFMRRNCPAIDTLRNEGKGMPVNYTGMIWSGFRPSDDACDFHYHIPSNMFVVAVLRQMQEIARYVFRDELFVKEMAKLEEEIEHGIRLYGVVHHANYGPIYAYETDGFGNHCLMDDAGTPSLMSIPYIGYTSNDDPIYQNTRKFILSKENPYYYEGKVAKGIGSPHTPPDYVWHLALSMQGLTASSKEEMMEVIEMMEATDASTGYMHEGFHADDPSQFTRSWFAWSNSMFSMLIHRAMDQGLFDK
ncbi:glycoside hydrolase family 125 protein [Cohnella terricola]|uniref:Glycoside hydrolase family 125 protein n=1 Tax=Cohnella terricola TaxID=1289167 RepID=A0A559JIY4_9BACL|nr:glycoside hydrolase family 125 protein [Cohnella terricola]TVX99831.1 glycoside hydrolase family 125 protein [Cohnella terricola]